MSKKTLISAALSVILLTAAIVLTSMLFGSGALTPAASQFKGVVNGCSKKSSSDIQGSYGRSSMYSVPSLIGCETVDDYMKACGMRFGYMSEEGTSTQKVYLVSSSESADQEDNWFNQGEFNLFTAVVGADYLDSEGELKTAYKSFAVVCGKNGGVLSIS